MKRIPQVRTTDKRCLATCEFQSEASRLLGERWARTSKSDAVVILSVLPSPDVATTSISRRSSLNRSRSRVCDLPDAEPQARGHLKLLPGRSAAKRKSFGAISLLGTRGRRYEIKVTRDLVVERQVSEKVNRPNPEAGWAMVRYLTGLVFSAELDDRSSHHRPSWHIETSLGESLKEFNERRLEVPVIVRKCSTDVQYGPMQEVRLLDLNASAEPQYDGTYDVCSGTAFLDSAFSDHLPTV